MKNQYFGDVRDLFKFDLIEELLKDKDLNFRYFLYVIMLTKDKGKGGFKRDYEKAIEEERPGTKNCPLMKCLRQVLAKSKDRKISKTMKGYYKDYPMDAIEDLLEKQGQADYFNRVYMQYFKKTCGRLLQNKKPVLVFLDPDTGLEPEASKGRKYVSYETISHLFNSLDNGSIVMIYQHGLWNFHSKRDTLKEITSNVVSITDNEIVFFFLAKGKERVKSVMGILKQYCRRYPRVRCSK